MARLSAVNMPQAPYTDMPLQSGDSFDLLEQMDAVGTRRRQAEKEEFELANMAQDRDYLLQKREAELQKTQAETRRLEADTRANNLKIDAQLGAARDTIDAFKGFDVGQMPPNMKQEVEEINRMLQGPLSEADEIILAGRISKAKQAMMIMRRQADLGVDLATMNQMRFDGEPVSQAMQDVMSDLDVYQSGTYAGMDADARATFDQEAADHRAALEAEIETRRAIGRTVQQRQEWQTKYEGMNQDMLRLRGMATQQGMPVFGEKYAGLFKKWEDTVARLKGGGFAGSSSLTYDDMQRAFNDMEQQYSTILSIADGQDKEIGNLGAQYNNALLEGDGIQKQYDTMMSNIDWMSTMLTLPGDSPFKSVAMEFLGPNMADLYSERWDDGSRWQTTVEPVLAQMKRFQELYKQQNNGVELPLGQAAQMLHEQSAKHTEIDRQLELQYGDEDTRSNIEQARDEVVLMQRFAETMPDGKIEPYVGHLDPAVDDVLNAHNPNEKDAKWKRRVNDAFVKAFPEEANKHKASAGRRALTGRRATSNYDNSIADRAMGYDDAGGATTDWPIMMYLAQHARTEGGQARVAKFLSLLAKEPYDGEPDFRQLSYEAADLEPQTNPQRSEIARQGRQIKEDPEAEAPIGSPKFSGPPMDTSTEAPVLVDPLTGRPLQETLDAEPEAPSSTPVDREPESPDSMSAESPVPEEEAQREQAMRAKKARRRRRR